MKLETEHVSEERKTEPDSSSNLNESSYIMINDSLIQNEESTVSQNNTSMLSPAMKKFMKGFLGQSRAAVLGGGVIVNHAAYLLYLMQPKITIADHQRLAIGFAAYCGLRGGAALGLELSGLKNKFDLAIPLYSNTEKNIIRMLVIVSFLRKMPIPTNYNFALQIAFSAMVVMDQGLAAKEFIAHGTDESPGRSIPEIQKRHADRYLLIVADILKEAASRGVQGGVTAYNAFYALADAFVDSTSTVDPTNQQKILIIMALVFAVLAAASVISPTTSKMYELLRETFIDTGLVFLFLLSLIFEYFPDFFSEHSLLTGLIILALVPGIPFFLGLLDKFGKEPSVVPVSIFQNKDLATGRNSLPGEMRSQVEEVLIDTAKTQEGSNYNV